MQRKMEPEKDLARVKKALSKIFELLEAYGPVWYTQDIHDELQSALHVLGKDEGAL